MAGPTTNRSPPVFATCEAIPTSSRQPRGRKVRPARIEVQSVGHRENFESMPKNRFAESMNETRKGKTNDGIEIQERRRVEQD